MIDFHSHLLPKMDDGSKSKEESVEMLKTMYEQGVEAVFSTPHFYPKREDPESFLARREHCVQRLLSVESVVPEKMELFLGAEVAYFFGMSRFEGLKELSLGGSDYILIEMPFDRWSQEEAEEILTLRDRVGLTPVLAHVERYLPFKNKPLVRYLAANGVLLQSNAEFFIARRTRRKALSMMKKGLVSLLGSDCHNLEDRPPNLAEGVRIIEKASKKDLLSVVRDTESEILAHAVPVRKE